MASLAQVADLIEPLLEVAKAAISKTLVSQFARLVVECDELEQDFDDFGVGFGFLPKEIVRCPAIDFAHNLEFVNLEFFVGSQRLGGFLYWI